MATLALKMNGVAAKFGLGFGPCLGLVVGEGLMLGQMLDLRLFLGQG